MEQAETKQAIDALAGGEWWHSDGGETYLELVRDLVAHGYSDAEALDFLTAAYGAAANEYGG